MCILSYLPAGAVVDDTVEEHLYNGGLSNPDGHGWAIASPHGMILGKSLDLDESLGKFVAVRNEYADSPALFHSRWATHGSIRVGNCHPFLVGKHHQTVLAHNGILPRDAHPAKDDDRSDTAILAEDIIPQRWFRLDKPTVIESITQWAGKANKLVILTVNPRYRKNAYLINENQGWWDNGTGVWHSNLDYTSPYPRWARVGAKSDSFSTKENWWEEDEYAAEYCLFCEPNKVALNFDNMCPSCKVCHDCYEPQWDCQCFTTDADSVASTSTELAIRYMYED
ncbi:MAG: class II glutamine amidotransferase [Fluviibacter sp.]